LFAKRNASGLPGLFVAMSLSLVFIFLDEKTTHLQPLRYALAYFSAPFYFAGDLPSQATQTLVDRLHSNDDLRETNAQLQQQILLLQLRVQKLAAMSAENVRLRELLSSSSRLDDRVTVVEIIGMDPDPARHEVIINQGANKDVRPGMPVLDSEGLMGQVVVVEPYSSRVILLTDPTHAIPVQVNRNGLRAIAVGGGRLDKLILTHVPDTADVVEGDLLVSSGLGQRFPEGYPVGVVSRVKHHPGLPFALIEAKPSARMNRSRHVLLLRNDNKNSDGK